MIFLCNRRRTELGKPHVLSTAYVTEPNDGEYSRRGLNLCGATEENSSRPFHSPRLNSAPYAYKARLMATLGAKCGVRNIPSEN
jgi:hypothetical protein